MTFNATFNNISVISWRSGLDEETGVHGEKTKTCRKSLTVHLHIMEMTVNSCVPVDLVLLAVILVVDVFVVVPGREITVISDRQKNS
jgi:hypothetical protein